MKPRWRGGILQSLQFNSAQLRAKSVAVGTCLHRLRGDISRGATRASGDGASHHFGESFHQNGGLALRAERSRKLAQARE